MEHSVLLRASSLNPSTPGSDIYAEEGMERPSKPEVMEDSIETASSRHNRTDECMNAETAQVPTYKIPVRRVGWAQSTP